MSKPDTARFIKTHCVALTGGAATGKSTVASHLRSLGYLVFDADQCSRRAVTPGKPALKRIIDTFGAKILSADGTLERAVLRNLILSGAEARKRLEAITHPAIQQEFAEEIARSDLFEHPRVFFYEAALIHESGRKPDFKLVWCTDCSKDLQLKRLTERGLSQTAARSLVDAQMPADEKTKLSDFVIDTSNSWESVVDQINKGLDLLK